MIKIRQCRQKDLDGCAELFAKVFSESPYKESWSISDARVYLKRFWKIDPEGCLVAEKDGRVVAGLFGYSYLWQKRVDYYVQELFVRKEYRRHGIALSLIKFLSKRLGPDVLISLVANEKTPAAKFYESIGLSQHRYYKFYCGHPIT